jgi:hypothetical protein
MRVKHAAAGFFLKAFESFSRAPLRSGVSITNADSFYRKRSFARFAGIAENGPGPYSGYSKGRGQHAPLRLQEEER